MRTQRIAQIVTQTDRISADLATLEQLELSTAYSNYICGGPWLSCMLWSTDGGAGDGVLTHYDAGAGARWTPHAEALPAVRELIERNFKVAKLKFARLGILRPGSVIIPHRDLLELDAPLHRLHVPLATDENCMFTERNIVYHMRRGDVWFLDASDVHSVACFSERNRVHLILDFGDDARPEDIMCVPFELGAGIAPDCVIQRRPIRAAEREAMLALGEVLDERNYRKILELVIHQHYRADGGENFVWNTVLELAERSRAHEARDKLYEMHRYYLMERSD